MSALHSFCQTHLQEDCEGVPDGLDGGFDDENDLGGNKDADNDDDKENRTWRRERGGGGMKIMTMATTEVSMLESGAKIMRAI